MKWYPAVFGVWVWPLYYGRDIFPKEISWAWYPQRMGRVAWQSKEFSISWLGYMFFIFALCLFLGPCTFSAHPILSSLSWGSSQRLSFRCTLNPSSPPPGNADHYILLKWRLSSCLAHSEDSARADCFFFVVFFFFAILKAEQKQSRGVTAVCLAFYGYVSHSIPRDSASWSLLRSHMTGQETKGLPRVSCESSWSLGKNPHSKRGLLSEFQSWHVVLGVLTSESPAAQMCQFPVTARTDDHKSGCLQQEELILSQLWKPEV